MFSKTNLETRDRFADNYLDSKIKIITEDLEPFSPAHKYELNHPISVNSLQSPKIQPIGSKISHLLQKQDGFVSKSRVVPLISGTDGCFHFHDDAANALNRYANKDVVFIGIWGSYTGDKSYFFDKILALCGIQDQKYSQSMIRYSQEYNMVFYERPFIKENLRIFLIDCRGYNDPYKLRKSEKVQLDILMSICQIIILVQTPPFQGKQSQDVIDIGYQHFNQSFKRLYVNKAENQDQFLPVDSISWPKSLFVLYSDTESVKKHQQITQKQEDLRQMFSDFNFSLLHTNNTLKHKKSLQTYISVNNPLDQLYLKNSQSIFLCIYKKLCPKVFNTLKCTGFTSPFMIMQLVSSLNNHNSIFLPKILQKARKNVYAQLYNRNALNYILKLKQYIHQQKAYNDKYLLMSFSQVYEDIMDDWDWNYEQIVTSKKKDKLYEHYQQKLEEYIEEKQKNVLYVNHKKSLDELEQINRIKLHNDNKNKSSYDRFVEVRQQFQNREQNYDGNAETQATGNALKYILSKRNQIKQKKQQIIETQDIELLQKKKLLASKKQQLQSAIYKTKIQREQILNRYEAEYRTQINKQKQIIQETEKYRQRIINLRNNKDQAQKGAKQLKQQVKQLVAQLEQNEQNLKQQLRASIMVRNKLLRQNDLAVVQKSKIMNSKIDEKKEQINSIQKSIFESKVKFYKQNKIAQKRQIRPQQNIKISKLY